MKEQTYGWYPSAKNVYEERRVETLTPYQLEALYRYRQSKYYQPPITPPEQTGRPSSRVSSHGGSRGQTEGSQCNIQPRVQSAPIHTTYKPPPRLNIPTPQQCWSTHVPETPITVPPQQQSPPPLCVSAMLPREPSPPKPPTPVCEYAVQSPTSAAQKKVRVQSATFRRNTPTKPSRPVKSAGPIRPTPSPVRYTPQEYVDPITQSDPTYPCSWPQPSAIDINDIPAADGIQFSPDRPPSGRMSISRQQASPAPSSKRTPVSTQRFGSGGLPPSGKRTPLRPKAPSPKQMEMRLQDEEVFDRCETPDYDEMTKKHGWMMEVHGDPLKLKKVSRRLPYFVQCEEPETERDPPKVHMENNETFFLNTIPRRPMGFAIDKEWISEIIHKKRMEMQKKHGINYRYKNFSFVY